MGHRLADLGVRTVADLSAADPYDLAAAFGPRTGPWLCQLALGGGDAKVAGEPWVARSRSRETTFPLDLTDRAEIEQQLRNLLYGLVQGVVADGRLVARVGVKVRLAPFFTSTRAAKLPAPTADAAEIELAALAVLHRFELARPVRLLGVRVEFEPLA